MPPLWRDFSPLLTQKSRWLRPKNAVACTRRRAGGRYAGVYSFTRGCSNGADWVQSRSSSRPLRRLLGRLVYPAKATMPPLGQYFARRRKRKRQTSPWRSPKGTDPGPAPFSPANQQFSRNHRKGHDRSREPPGKPTPLMGRGRCPCCGSTSLACKNTRADLGSQGRGSPIQGMRKRRTSADDTRTGDDFPASSGQQRD
jgi:hypothetical protein